jgi:GntR family transcriptional regulator
MVVFGDHADAISLSQATKEIFFGPSELEALTFDVQHFGHVAPNQPTDLDLQRLLRGMNPTHDGLLAMRIVVGSPANSGQGADNIKGSQNGTRGIDTGILRICESVFSRSVTHAQQFFWLHRSQTLTRNASEGGRFTRRRQSISSRGFHSLVDGSGNRTLWRAFLGCRLDTHDNCTIIVSTGREAAMQFQINTASKIPIYRQLTEQIRSAIARGDLQPDEQLPSVRQLSKDVVVNPNTIARVYQELEREGMLVTRQGLGVFVGAPKRDLVKRARDERLHELLDKLLTEAVHLGYSSGEVKEMLAKRLKQFQWTE